MSSRFDNCMHLHAMGVCCLSVSPFPEKTHSRPLSRLALSRVSRSWLEGWHVRHLFTIYMLGQRPQLQLALRSMMFITTCTWWESACW